MRSFFTSSRRPRLRSGNLRAIRAAAWRIAALRCGVQGDDALHDGSHRTSVWPSCSGVSDLTGRTRNRRRCSGSRADIEHPAFAGSEQRALLVPECWRPIRRIQSQNTHAGSNAIFRIPVPQSKCSEGSEEARAHSEYERTRSARGSRHG